MTSSIYHSSEPLAYDLEYWPVVLLAFIPFLLTLTLSIYVFFSMPLRRLNVFFVLFLTTLFLWQFTDSIVRISANIHTVRTWFNALSPATNFLAPFAMHFTLLFTGKSRWVSKPWVLCLLYVPAFFFAVASLVGYIRYEIHPSETWRWTISPGKDVLTEAGNYWIGTLALLVLGRLLQYVIQTKNDKTRHAQARLVAIGFSIPAIQGITTELLFPYVFNRESMPITSLSMFAFSVCVTLGLLRYRLLSYSPRHSWTSIINDMNEGVLIVDNFDVIRFANPRFCRILGYREEELIGNIANELLVREGDRDVIAGAIKRRISGKSDRYEMKLVTRCGRTIISEISGSPYTDAKGKVIGSVGIMTDVTEERRSMIVQKIAQYILQMVVGGKDGFGDFSRMVCETMNEVIDTSNFYIALIDKDANTLQFPLLIDQFTVHGEENYTRKFANGLTEFLIGEEKSLLLTRTDMEQLEKKGQINVYGEKSESWLGVPLRAGNEIIGAMVIQSYNNRGAFDQSDILFMERIAVHVARMIDKMKTEQELREKEYLLSTYVEESLLPIYICCADSGMIVQANEAFFQLTGYSRHDLERLTTFDVFNITPDEIKNQILSHERGIKTSVMERQWKTGHGNILDMLVSVNYIEQGKKPLVFITGLNITQRKKHENQLHVKHHEAMQYQSMLLSSQISPHFIFNALNSVQYYVLNENVEPALNFISEFSQLMRSVLNNSMRTHITLAEEIKFLELYLNLERKRFSDKFSYEIELETNIDPDEYVIPPMLLQPYLENMVIHGIGNLEGKGKIKIYFHEKNDHFMCIMEDNGVGREAARKLKVLKSGSCSNRSVGMDLTANRLAVLNDLSFNNYNVSIVDLKDEQGSAAGTQIEVSFPVIKGV